MAKDLVLSCQLPCDPEEVRAQILRPALFLHVAAPLVEFNPVGLERFPEVWSEGEFRGSMKLLGLIPIGWQAIVVELSNEDGAVLRDRGYGPMLKEWDHRIEVAPSPSGTLYTDRLRMDAGPFTPIAAFFVNLFFRHRQRRLTKLAQNQFKAIEPKAG